MEKVMLKKLRKGVWFIDHSGEVYRKGESISNFSGEPYCAVYGVTPDAISHGVLASSTMVLPFPKTKSNKAQVKALFDLKSSCKDE